MAVGGHPRVVGEASWHAIFGGLLPGSSLPGVSEIADRGGQGAEVGVFLGANERAD